MQVTDQLELAWGIIANASDWDRDDRPEWVLAANRWGAANGFCELADPETRRRLELAAKKFEKMREGS